MAINVPAKYRKYVWIGGGILILYILVRIWAAIPAYDSKKMGEYAASRTAYNKLKKSTEASTAALLDKIAAGNVVIAAQDAEIARNNKTISDGQKNQSDLEKAYLLLTDCPAQNKNLIAQVANMKEVAANWEGQYYTEHGTRLTIATQRDGYLAAYNAEHALRRASEDNTAACDAVRAQLARDLKIAHLVGTIKSGIVMAAGAYIAYSLLKK